jgi:hypothetical protein
VGKLVGAAVLAAIALFMLSGFFASGAQMGAASLAALALGVGLPGACAGLLVRAHRRERTLGDGRREALRDQTLDLDILRLAREHAGRLTAVEVAMELSVAPEHAQAALDRLMLRRVADVEVTDDGVLVYAFHDIRHLEGKHTARGVLDA